MKKISDLEPFEHGEEGTHYACQEMTEKYGSKVNCCGCNKHKCKTKTTTELCGCEADEQGIEHTIDAHFPDQDNKTTTETREAIEYIVKAVYAGSPYEEAIDEIMQLIAKAEERRAVSEKKALLERVKQKVIGDGVPQILTKQNIKYETGWCNGRNELREEQYKRLQKLESEIGE